MTVELYPPLALHEKGRRIKNEDCIYPAIDDADGMSTSRFFMVCDGVGGAEKGEEASRIVCESFAAHLHRFGKTNWEDIQHALTLAETNMDAYVEAHPEADGMATTLSIVVFGEDGAIISHIGDSRIYHLRHGQILFKTMDHSLVNEMVMNNIITEEEAATHPKRNVVSRAIMGSQRPARMDMALINDIQVNDYFFLCTDGIIESVSDHTLSSILSENGHPDNFKLSQIFSLCEQHSKDNFSAYLLRIKSIEQSDSTVAPQTREAGEESGSGFFPKWMAYLLMFSSIATVAMVFFIFFPIKPPSKLKQVKTAPQTDQNVHNSTLGLPQPDAGYTWPAIQNDSISTPEGSDTSNYEPKLDNNQQ